MVRREMPRQERLRGWTSRSKGSRWMGVKKTGEYGCFLVLRLSYARNMYDEP